MMENDWIEKCWLCRKIGEPDAREYPELTMPSGNVEKVKIRSVTAYCQAFWHYLRLADKRPEVSSKAMSALRELGDASVGLMRFGVSRSDQPLLQLRCSVVLHWLNCREGMEFLVDYLRHLAENKNSLDEELFNCFIAIGLPDTTPALATVWGHLTQISDTNRSAVLIHRVLLSLDDAKALPAVCDTAAATPELFLSLVTHFGDRALSNVRTLTLHPLDRNRLMGVHALATIGGTDAASTVTAMLRDNSDLVRSAAPLALERISGPILTLKALVSAHRAGYASFDSVHLLRTYNPPEIHQLLIELIRRFGSQDTYDSESSIVEALAALTEGPWSLADVVPDVIALVHRNVSDEIQTAGAYCLGAAIMRNEQPDLTHTERAVFRLLTRTDSRTRFAAAEALLAMNEPLGSEFAAAIDAARPQSSLLKRLQSSIANSQDVGEAVSLAVQHVASWFQKVSRETADRFATTGSERERLEAAVLSDPRVLDLLAALLKNALELVRADMSDTRLIEALGAAIATLKLIAGRKHQTAEQLDDVLKAALRVCWYPKRQASYLLSASAALQSAKSYEDAVQELCGQTREAAGLAVIALYGSDWLDELYICLQHSELSVQVSAAVTLGKLGDTRAVNLLQTHAVSRDAILAAACQDAISAIRRTNPEMMTLLRGASPNQQSYNALLRPASAGIVSDENLLRPADDEPLTS